ncbi:unnamed protein product [Phytomonas sp. EM1]|nr:unnamed protein product [Phytomonas sp. EM1]|eukprot:CCW59591.1 unnamed protein product [Phytomonas sp. isolate EM1]
MMTPDTCSLVMSAPDDEATFLSLPYIEELLYWFKRSYPKIHSSYPFDEGNTSVERWGASATSQISSLVRSRVETERYFEEKYFDDSKRIQVLNNPFEAVARPTTPSETGSARHERTVSASNEIKTRYSRSSSAKAHDTKRCSASEQPERKNEPLSTFASPSQPPLGLLWIGLFRALGFPLDVIVKAPTDATTAMTPPTQVVSEIMEDDLVLGRKLCDFSAHAIDSSKDARILGYMHQDGDALRYTALVEWFEDLLAFIVDNAFSCQQARCVLLDALALLRCLEGLPVDATEEDVGQVVEALMTNALNVQACPVPTHVNVPHTLYEPIMGQMRDPKLTASIEHRLQTDRKLDKRQRVALMEALENIPLHVVTLMKPRRIEVPIEMAVGPYFSTDDVKAVLNFLISSAVMHWRLFTFILSQPQAVDVRTTTLVLEDILPCFVPPLAGFMFDEEHELALKMETAWREAFREANEMFNGVYMCPIEEMQAQEIQERQAIIAAEEAAKQKNLDDALSQKEYERVERAFNLRLQNSLGVEPFLPSASTQTISGRCDSPAVAAAAVADNAAAPSATSHGTPPLVGRLSHAGRPSLRQQKTLRGSTISTVVLPPLPRRETDKDSHDSSPFVLSEVEKRVEKIEACMEERLAESATVRTKNTVRRK